MCSAQCGCFFVLPWFRVFQVLLFIIIIVIIIVIQPCNGSLLGVVSDWLLLNRARALISWRWEEKMAAAWYIKNFCDGNVYTSNVILRSARKYLSIFLRKIWARMCGETNTWDSVKRGPYVMRFGLFPSLTGGRGFIPSSSPWWDIPQ